MNDLGIIDPILVSKYIIKYANINNLYITVNTLQEILYDIDKEFILNRGYKLITEDFLAKESGPVLESVDKEYGDMGIFPLILEEDIEDLELNEEEIEVINKLIVNRLDIPEWERGVKREYTKNSPWYNVYKNGDGLNNPITIEHIMYYK